MQVCLLYHDTTYAANSSFEYLLFPRLLSRNIWNIDLWIQLFFLVSPFYNFPEKGSCGKRISLNQHFLAKICFRACILKLARSECGFTHPSHLNKLIVLQNKAVKLIGGGKPRDSPTKFHSILKILDKYKLEVAKFVYTHFTKKLPHKTTNYFAKKSEITKRATRSFNLL